MWPDAMFWAVRLSLVAPCGEINWLLLPRSPIDTGHRHLIGTLTAYLFLDEAELPYFEWSKVRILVWDVSSLTTSAKA
jgi:hypothetical protein